MPLSEHEQRLLEQMERALYAEDPKFAPSLRSGAAGRASRGRGEARSRRAVGGVEIPWARRRLGWQRADAGGRSHRARCQLYGVETQTRIVRYEQKATATGAAE